jgi:hypothetical protein
MMVGLSGIRTVRLVLRTDGIVDRWASGWDGTIFWTGDRDSETADRDSENFCLESSAESSDITLNSGIPDKSIFTNK